MKDEYIIVNKTQILERIEELEKEKASNISQNLIGFANQNQGEINAMREVLSKSTPLIPIKPLQELINEGYDPYDSAHHLQVQRMLKVIQNYISNLKLKI